MRRPRMAKPYQPDRISNATQLEILISMVKDVWWFRQGHIGLWKTVRDQGIRKSRKGSNSHDNYKWLTSMTNSNLHSYNLFLNSFVGAIRFINLARLEITWMKRL